MTKLEDAVRKMVEERGDEKDAFVNDVLTYGCASGAIPELIYTSDIYKFFDEYYDDIEALREEFAEECGEPLRVKGDLKTFLTWLAFEETVARLYG